MLKAGQGTSSAYIGKSVRIFSILLSASAVYERYAATEQTESMSNDSRDVKMYIFVKELIFDVEGGVNIDPSKLIVREMKIRCLRVMIE